ncbi:MAG: hypothetical protein SV375_21060, partial [Thermodesulfobacteriota bacterium]|nr:hypothetical protein [Thermodesulfobacteriota bacterium]
MDKEINPQENDITKLRQPILPAYIRFLEMEKVDWSCNVLKQAQSEDLLEDCGASSPKIFWKVGYGAFYASRKQGLFFSCVSPFRLMSGVSPGP